MIGPVWRGQEGKDLGKWNNTEKKIFPETEKIVENYFFLAMQQPATKRHSWHMYFGKYQMQSLSLHVQVSVESRKAQGSLSSLRSYCGSRGLLVARSRPGFQHVMLLLSVKAVQLVQVSSQLEHPCSFSITPLLTIVGGNRKVTITIIIVLSSGRCKMTFRKGCMYNGNSDYSCTYIKLPLLCLEVFVLRFHVVENTTDQFWRK